MLKSNLFLIFVNQHFAPTQRGMKFTSERGLVAASFRACRVFSVVWNDAISKECDLKDVPDRLLQCRELQGGFWSSVETRAQPYFMPPILNLRYETRQPRDWRGFR